MSPEKPQMRTSYDEIKQLTCSKMTRRSWQTFLSHGKSQLVQILFHALLIASIPERAQDCQGCQICSHPSCMPRNWSMLQLAN